MEMSQRSPENCSQTPDYVDREYNIVPDQQSFLEIFTQENEKVVKQKINDDWLIQTTQTKLKESENIQDEQKSIIQELQIKNKQLERTLTNENNLRTKILESMKKIEEVMNVYVSTFNQIKTNYDSCVETKNKLSALYDKRVEEIQHLYHSTTIERIKHNDIREAMKVMFDDLRDRYQNAVQEYKEMINKKDEEIYSLKEDLRTLEMKRSELDNNNKNLIKELHEILSHKDKLMDELMCVKEKYETSLKNFEQSQTSFYEDISKLNQNLNEYKESYEKSEKECESLQSALNEQNNFLNEIQTKNMNLENLLSESEQALLVAENNVKDLEDKYKEMDLNNSELKQDSNAAHEKILKLETEYFELNKTVEEYKMKIEELETEHEKYVELETQLKFQLHAKSDEFLELQKNYDDLQENLVELKEKESDLQTQTKTFANEKEMFQVRIRGLQNEVDATKDKGEEKLRTVKEDSEAKIQQLKEQAQYYKEEIDKIRETEKKKYDKEINTLNDRLRLMEFQITELTASKQYLQTELEKKLTSVPAEKELTIHKSQPTQPLGLSHTQKPKRYNSPPRKQLKFGSWDDSESDSSVDKTIADLARRFKHNDASKMRIVPPKRRISISSNSELDVSPTQLPSKPIEIDTDLFDSLREPSFREPFAKKPKQTRKSNRKPIM